MSLSIPSSGRLPPLSPYIGVDVGKSKPALVPSEHAHQNVAQIKLEYYLLHTLFHLYGP